MIPSPCIPGMFLNKSTSLCQVCPPGTFTDKYGVAKCLPCPLNHIAPNNATAQCTICKIGKRTIEVGQVECKDCPFYQFDMSDDQCKGSKIRVFLTPLILLSLVGYSAYFRYLQRAKLRSQEEYDRRCELLKIIRRGGISLNQKYRPPMSEITSSHPPNPPNPNC